ncbi:WD40-repeat-containing domain protein [Chaetomium strumarium]|uniref:WD40-repeat-containing domain protein n=1 Tax=Chaetomium strumarium TaxID=1170767 RepID=A0AAJ0GQZ6_9PEZI|nr:WD40-repeat-containing domain protein [Chaetomium strumarium]
MSSLVATTTSHHRLQIHPVAGVSPTSNRLLLTSPPRLEARPPKAPAPGPAPGEVEEPPAKRIRLLDLNLPSNPEAPVPVTPLPASLEAPRKSLPSARPPINVSLPNGTPTLPNRTDPERGSSRLTVSFPNRPRTLPNGIDSSPDSSKVTATAKASSKQTEVIVISDDEEIPQRQVAVVGKPAVPRAQTQPKPRRPAVHEGTEPTSKWLSSQDRRWPYIKTSDRRAILAGIQSSIQLRPQDLAAPATFHVDFKPGEISYLRDLARRCLKFPTERGGKDPKRDLVRILRKNPQFLPKILDAFTREKRLALRTRADVENLFQDLLDQRSVSDTLLLTVQTADYDERDDLVQSSRLQSLLFARSIAGHRGFGSMRSFGHFNNEFKKYREDGLEKVAEWTGCAGDIATIIWVSNDAFICGTTEHSDSHNQQYNKPGNLVMGSCSQGTLRAYPEHRIVRPVVPEGENSSEAMRRSQDPWLYSSVVSSDYDAVHDRAFTSSFDRTVKVWRVEKAGSSMTLLGEWSHDGNVNFVAASKHKSGMVATAADVASDAVRIYNVNETDISESTFQAYSCSRVTDEEGNTVSTEKWAYFPATMQWGLADSVKHMLLVGYSPRSRTEDDYDIPEQRRDTGELCLWDGLTGERWRVTSATTQNVFEVLWHPNQPCFIAATSPLGLDLAPSVRTQIRIFKPADQYEHGFKAYSPVMALDCTALDINELTIMPNSFSYCYVTAGCTDGNTYVWDTARGEKPIHVLRHDPPIDEFRGDREREDVGVKFTAWGTTPDRFYTGSSDGVVKVWNVRSLNRPLVRNMLEAPAPITAGMFCPDKSRLVIGDASGRVYMLSVEEEKKQQLATLKIPLPGSGYKLLHRPPSIIPHPDPPAPTHDAEGRPIVAETGPALGHNYLASQKLERHPNPTIGVVQGPRYAETGLFRRDLHFNEDPNQPLLARWEAIQQEAAKPLRPYLSKRRDQAMALRPLQEIESLRRVHNKNTGVDCDIQALSNVTPFIFERVNEFLRDDYPLRYEEE